MNTGIIHVRIDDRLIHGQVAAYWSHALKVSRIMVANDKVANDPMQKSVLRMAAPAEMRTSIITKEVAAKNIQAGKYSNQRVFLILKNPKDAYELIKLGVEIKSINVGNMAHKEGTIAIKRNIHATEDDIEYFKKLNELGVELTSILVPDEAHSNLMDYINKISKSN